MQIRTNFLKIVPLRAMLPSDLNFELDILYMGKFVKLCRPLLKKDCLKTKPIFMTQSAEHGRTRRDLARAR